MAAQSQSITQSFDSIFVFSIEGNVLWLKSWAMEKTRIATYSLKI